MKIAELLTETEQDPMFWGLHPRAVYFLQTRLPDVTSRKQAIDMIKTKQLRLLATGVFLDKKHIGSKNDWAHILDWLDVNVRYEQSAPYQPTVVTVTPRTENEPTQTARIRNQRVTPETLAREQQALDLRDNQNLSFREIGEKLGMGAGQARDTYNRASRHQREEASR